MKKRFVLIFAMLMALILALGLFVACNPKEDDNKQDAGEYTVRFDLNGEGQDVSVTGKTGEDISAKIPTLQDKASYYFGGWYLNADLSGERVKPETAIGNKDVTYHAKWYVKYAFRAQVEQLDGSYVADEEFDLIGESVKGERSEVSVTAADYSEKMPEGHSLEESIYTISFASGQRDYERDVRLSFSALGVTYVSGLDGVDSVRRDVKYGSAAEGRDVFGKQDKKLLLGFSAQEGGDVDIELGEPIMLSGNVTLWAVWADAYIDAFGGGDLVYISEVDDCVYLEKRGYELVKGEFDKTSEMFSFENENGETLDGKLLKSKFFYFKDSYFNTFSSDIDGDVDTLTLGEGGSATYRDKAGAAHLGVYDVNEENGHFTFEAEGLSFEFILVEPLLGVGNITFIRDDGLAGYYAERSLGEYGYNVIYLDGYGNAFEVWDPDAPYFNVYDQTYEIYFEGEYVVKSTDDGVVIELDIERVPNYFVTASYQVRLDTSVSGKFGGVQLSGVYAIGDDYGGTYNLEGDEKNKTKQLVLDGYEYATYCGVEGVYSAERLAWYVFNGETDDETGNNIYDTHMHSYIRFVSYVDDSVTLLELSRDDYAYNTYSVLSSDMNVFTFENSPELLYSLSADSIMVELWHEKASVYQKHVDSYGITYYTLLDEGALTTLSDGWTRFVGNVTFEFKVTDNSQAFTLRWRGEQSRIVFVEGELYIEDDGVGKYVVGGETRNVDYTCERGIVDVYTFSIGGNSRTFVVSDGGKTVEEIDGDKIYEQADGEGYVLTLRLLELSGDRAIIGFLLSDKKSYAYLIEGTLVDLGGEVRRFDGVAFDEDYESMLDSYGLKSFEFKFADGGFILSDGFKVRATSEDGTFVTDGYGNATLTLSGQSPIDGTYAFLAADTSLIAFDHDGGTRYIKVTGEGEERELTLLGDEAGYYYEISAGSISYNGTYVFLDGEGNVRIFNYNAAHNTHIISEGKYSRAEKDSLDGYKDYVFDFENDDNYDVKGKYLAHLGEKKLQAGVIAKVYYFENAASTGTYAVYLGGEPYGIITVTDNTAFWYLGEEDYAVGSMFICDVLDKVYTANALDSWDIVENENGDSIIFYSGNYGDDDYFEFIFDFTGEYYEADNGSRLPIIDARIMDYGTYARREGSLTDETMYLDGHGNATLYDGEGKETDRGKYSIKEQGENVLTFVGKDSFDFVIYMREGSTAFAMPTFEYMRFDAYTEGIYVSSDWTLLALDGYDGATMIDKYGVATVGTYTRFTKNIVKVETSLFDVYYFAIDDSSFERLTSDFLAVDGVLYAYLGNKYDIEIPDGIHTIAEGAFSGSTINSVKLNGVLHIGDYAFAGLTIEEISSDRLLTIGEGAFANMGEKLKRAYLPAVTSIGEGAFYGDYAIERVTLGDITEVGQYAFTIMQDSATVTLLDMSGVKDPSAVKFADNAFVATDFEGAEIEDGEISALRVLFKDISAVNAYVKSENRNATALSYAVICYGDEVTTFAGTQTEFGKTFFSIAGGELFLLDGRLSRVAENDALVSVGLYDVLGGKLAIYAKLDDGTFDSSPVMQQGNVLKVGDYTLLQIGVSHEFTEGENTLKLTFGVSYDVMDGIVVNVASMEYRGQKIEGARLNGNEIRFQIDGGELVATLISENECTVKAGGTVRTLTSRGGKYTLELVVADDGKLVGCTSFGKVKASGVDTSTIIEVKLLDDGSLLVIVKGIIDLWSETYHVCYKDDVLDVYQRISDGTGEIFVTVETGEDYEIAKIVEFKIGDEALPVLSFEIVEHGNVHITIAEAGGEAVYEMIYESDSYDFTLKSITKIE